MAGKPKSTRRKATGTKTKDKSSIRDDSSITSQFKDPPKKSVSEKELKPSPSFTFARVHFINFVISTFGVWFFVILISLSFRFELTFTIETLREMTGDSIALAGIPFAILSVLAVLGSEHDNYLKIALAAIASVFLIIAFSCFLALWIYGDYNPAITQSYSIKILLGFLGALVFQGSWIIVSSPSSRGRPFQNLHFTVAQRAFFDVALFILSFLVVQISVSQDVQYNLIPFIWVGFSGGLTALIVLILITITRLPEGQTNDLLSP